MRSQRVRSFGSEPAADVDGEAASWRERDVRQRDGCGRPLRYRTLPKGHSLWDEADLRLRDAPRGDGSPGDEGNAIHGDGEVDVFLDAFSRRQPSPFVWLVEIHVRVT